MFPEFIISTNLNTLGFRTLYEAFKIVLELCSNQSVADGRTDGHTHEQRQIYITTSLARHKNMARITDQMIRTLARGMPRTIGSHEFREF